MVQARITHLVHPLGLNIHTTTVTVSPAKPALVPIMSPRPAPPPQTETALIVSRVFTVHLLHLETRAPALPVALVDPLQ